MYRACPGMHLADAAVWLGLASILASFDILPPINPETGKEEMPEERFASGFTRCANSHSVYVTHCSSC